MHVSMPLMTGNEATRWIKTQLPETRVIAMSMYDEPDKIELMNQAGTGGYVLKPASADDLLAAIRVKSSAAGEPELGGVVPPAGRSRAAD